MKKIVFSSMISWSLLVSAIAILSPFAHATTYYGGSFTPTSVLIPIMEVGLVDPSSGSDYAIYKCPAATAAGCALDVANASALSSFFGAIPAKGALPTPKSTPTTGPTSLPTSTPGIRANTYKQLYVRTCESPATSYQIQVEGSVTLNGTTLYTQSGGSDPLTSTASNEGYVPMTLSGCQTNYNLPGGVTVSAGSKLTLNLLTNVTNLVDAFTIPSANMAANASAMCDTGATYSVCFNYPPLMPYLGTGTPVRESYGLTDAADTVSGNTAPRTFAQIDFYITPSGGIIGAVMRPVYNSSTPVGLGWGGTSTTYWPSALPYNACESSSGQTAGACSFGYDPWSVTFKNFSVNSDGTYNLISYSGASSPPSGQFTATDTTDVDVIIPKFTRISAVGGTPTSFTATSNRGLFSAGGSSLSNSVVVTGIAYRIQ